MDVNELATMIASPPRESDLLIEVYAPWCPKCLMLKTLIQEVARYRERSGTGPEVVVIDGTVASLEGISVPKELNMMLAWSKTEGVPSFFYLSRTGGVTNMKTYSG